MITVSDQAHIKAKDFIEENSGLGIRLGVKTTGCSGLAYTLEFANEIKSHDKVFDYTDFKIVVDEKSLPFLDGIHIDYVKDGLNEGFEFSNPNITGECGCGLSFRV
jgi:iron-sulfur cluster assembly protein